MSTIVLSSSPSSSFLLENYNEKFKQWENNYEALIDEMHSNGTSVWELPNKSQQTAFVMAMYAFVIPVICGLGIVANTLNIIIFTRTRFTAARCSVYCYLRGNNNYFQ